MIFFVQRFLAKKYTRKFAKAFQNNDFHLAKQFVKETPYLDITQISVKELKDWITYLVGQNEKEYLGYVFEKLNHISLNLGKENVLSYALETCAKKPELIIEIIRTNKEMKGLFREMGFDITQPPKDAKDFIKKTKTIPFKFSGYPLAFSSTKNKELNALAKKSFVDKKFADVFDYVIDYYRCECGLKDKNKIESVNNYSALSENHIIAAQRKVRRNIFLKGRVRDFSSRNKVYEFMQRKLSGKVVFPKEWAMFNNVILEIQREGLIIREIKHVTSVQNFASILEHGGIMYGAKNLIAKRFPFVMETLSLRDVQNGDANLVCFGVDKIDCSKRQDWITCVLDLKHLRGLSNVIVKPFDTEMIREFMKTSDLGNWKISFKNSRENKFLGADKYIEIEDTRTGQSVKVWLNAEREYFLDLYQVDAYFVSWIFKILNNDHKIAQRFKQDLLDNTKEEQKRILVKMAKVICSTAEVDIIGGFKLNLQDARIFLSNANKRVCLDKKKLMLFMNQPQKKIQAKLRELLKEGDCSKVPGNRRLTQKRMFDTKENV